MEAFKLREAEEKQKAREAAKEKEKERKEKNKAKRKQKKRELKQPDNNEVLEQSVEKAQEVLIPISSQPVVIEVSPVVVLEEPVKVSDQLVTVPAEPVKILAPIVKTLVEVLQVPIVSSNIPHMQLDDHPIYPLAYAHGFPRAFAILSVKYPGCVVAIGGTTRNYYLYRENHRDLDILIINVSAKTIQADFPKAAILGDGNYAPLKLTLDDTNVDIGNVRRKAKESLREVILKEGSKRDFTMNTIGIRLTNRGIDRLDYFNGYQDLTRLNEIKSINDNPYYFFENTAAAVRAVRFKREYELLSYHPTTQVQLSKVKQNPMRFVRACLAHGFSQVARNVTACFEVLENEVVYLAFTESGLLGPLLTLGILNAEKLQSLIKVAIEKEEPSEVSVTSHGLFQSNTANRFLSEDKWPVLQIGYRGK